MRVDPVKQQANLDKHGIAPTECEAAFDNPMLTREDSRVQYGEPRFITGQKAVSWCWYGRTVRTVHD